MTFWKVDVLNADIFTQRTHWFWNSSDAAVFCDSLSGDVYENAYHCHEVQIPDVVVEHNGIIIPKIKYKKKNLKNNDKVEIVHFIGGG